MDILEVLQVEHGVLRRFLGLIERHADANPQANALVEVCSMAAQLLRSHVRMEDELLFKELEPRIAEYGPLVLLDHRGEHREIDVAFRKAAELGQESVGHALAAAKYARAHFAKEEKIIFSIARRALKAEVLAELGRRTPAYRSDVGK
jgi:hemerythrin-like domain-containing protein